VFVPVSANKFFFRLRDSGKNFLLCACGACFCLAARSRIRPATPPWVHAGLVFYMAGRHWTEIMYLSGWWKFQASAVRWDWPSLAPLSVGRFLLFFFHKKKVRRDSVIKIHKATRGTLTERPLLHLNCVGWPCFVCLTLSLFILFLFYFF
jgi:hypothetical protein